MKEVFDNLLSIINNSRKIDKDFVIAWTLLYNMEDIDGIYELADKCNVSPASITRFCNKMGIDNFYTFKNFYTKSYVFHKNHSFITREEANLHYTDPASAFSLLSENAKLLFTKTADHFDFKKIDNILKIIHDSNRVFLTGEMTSLGLAQEFQLKLAYLGRFTEAPIYVEPQEALIHEFTLNDAIILFSSTGKIYEYRPAFIEKLIESNATVIVFTQNHQMPFLDLVDHVFLFGDPNYHLEGYYVLHALVHYMAKRYFILYGAKGLKNDQTV